MMNIVSISADYVVIVYPDQDNFTITYYNCPSGRSKVQSALSETTLWDEVILPEWGDAPTVLDPQPTQTISIDKIRSDKQQQIKAICRSKIIEGIDADLGLCDSTGQPLGTLHYTLSEKNQTDMRDLVGMISSGATEVTWRDDSRVSHMIYTAAQFLVLYKLSSEHILRCRFKSDALEELLKSYSDDQVDEIGAISWDSEIPEAIEDRMNELLQVMLNDTGDNK